LPQIPGFGDGFVSFRPGRTPGRKAGSISSGSA